MAVSPEELVKAGRLTEALSALQALVRERTGDAKYRVFLTQLLCVLGQWDKALNQAKVAAQLDPQNMPLATLLSATIEAEKKRADVFGGKATPTIFGPAEEWMAWLIQSSALAATGAAGEADALRARALDAAPVTPGSIDGRRFEWISDADARLGPMLEAIVNGTYYWMPLTVLRSVELEKPQQLRDAVWTQGILTFTNGGQALAQIPTRYAGSAESADPAIQLGRKTDWRPIGENAAAGIGQRMFQTDADDHPLLEIRRIDFDVPEGAPAPSETAALPESAPPGGSSVSLTSKLNA